MDAMMIWLATMPPRIAIDRLVLGFAAFNKLMSSNLRELLVLNLQLYLSILLNLQLSSLKLLSPKLLKKVWSNF